MDDVILRCAKRHLKNQNNLEFVRKQIVAKTYGFDYEQHFRKMLIQLLGVIVVERIEKRVDPGRHLKLTATLQVLKKTRNTEAHTHLKGVTKHINAPSLTLGQLEALYGGLKEFESILRQGKF